MNKPIKTFEEFLELLPNDVKWYLTEDLNFLRRDDENGIRTCPLCFVAGEAGSLTAISSGKLLGMPLDLITLIMRSADCQMGASEKNIRQRMLAKVGLL